MGQPVTRGQYITSINRLARDLNISARQVRTALMRLEKTGEIDTQPTNKNTLITVCNYDSYQIEEAPKKKKATRKRHADDTQPTHINKKERKEEEKKNYFLEASAEKIWVDTVAMQYHISRSKALSALARFNTHLLLTNDEKRSLKDFKTHFVNWLKYNVEDVEDNGSQSFKWKWRGQATKTGTKEEYERDKAMFDKDGFDFKTLQ
jgi:DNA-binding transcriptional regulator YhcF (GntR family)